MSWFGPFYTTYEEESDSEPEVDECEYVPEETEEKISLLQKEKIIFLNA